MNVLAFFGAGLIAGAVLARRTAIRFGPAVAWGVAGAVLGGFLLAPLSFRGPLLAPLAATAGALALAALAGALRRS